MRLHKQCTFVLAHEKLEKHCSCSRFIFVRLQYSLTKLHLEKKSVIQTSVGENDKQAYNKRKIKTAWTVGG